MLAAVIGSWDLVPSVAFFALDLDAFVWLAFTNEFLAALILVHNDRFFVVLAALWLWALDISTFLWNTNVLVTTVVNLISHKFFIEFGPW